MCVFYAVQRKCVGDAGFPQGSEASGRRRGREEKDGYLQRGPGPGLLSWLPLMAEGGGRRQP